ncbi:GAF and ANTAR domain-containing protein [Salinibacterium sp. ZJ454]|uniref:GAF and ANTAR domain-containing protein n=1 Tax=Salinibacterium sp. ZJ454 TaxID=2708339 RepID=UPI00142429A9|nr:GAF and ANTAR domain-containing protein [Salinibacterium sp. ZJ454]
MTDDAAFAAADTGDGAELCLPFIVALAATGAAISTLGDPFGIEMVCASDAAAALLDEAQIDLGEGPGWDAASARLPVIVADIRAESGSSWPMLARSVNRAHVRAVHAFPLRVGALGIGAVTVYSDEPGAMAPEKLTVATGLASVAATHVMRRALARDPQELTDVAYSRREVHQATGVVIAQLRLSAEDALLLIRAHSFASGIPVRDVAALIIGGALNLAR